MRTKRLANSLWLIFEFVFGRKETILFNIEWISELNLSKHGNCHYQLHYKMVSSFPLRNTMLLSSLEGKPSHTMQNEVGSKPGAVAVQLNSKLLTAHMTVQNDVGQFNWKLLTKSIKLKTFDSPHDFASHILRTRQVTTRSSRQLNIAILSYL